MPTSVLGSIEVVWRDGVEDQGIDRIDRQVDHGLLGYAVRGSTPRRRCIGRLVHATFRGGVQRVGVDGIHLEVVRPQVEPVVHRSPREATIDGFEDAERIVGLVQGGHRVHDVRVVRVDHDDVHRGD